MHQKLKAKGLIVIDSVSLRKRYDDVLRSISQSTIRLDFTGLGLDNLKPQYSKIDESISRKPKLRVIQHFACSGGTIISKCLRSMPNAFLLSELHPTTRLHLVDQPPYSPRDIASQALYGDLPGIDDVNTRAFISQLLDTNEHVYNFGGDLVIRDHTHADFCVGDVTENGSALFKIIPDSVLTLRVATIRNPIDAYLSLKSNGWIHFSPSHFDEYCRRFLKFLESYDNNNIFKYESFVSDPCGFMKAVCCALDIAYSDIFLECFKFYRVSGDSGRSSDVIEKRPRRPLSNEYLKEIESSPHMKTVNELYGYDLP